MEGGLKLCYGKIIAQKVWEGVGWDQPPTNTFLPLLYMALEGGTKPKRFS